MESEEVNLVVRRHLRVLQKTHTSSVWESESAARFWPNGQHLRPASVSQEATTAVSGKHKGVYTFTLTPTSWPKWKGVKWPTCLLHTLSSWVEAYLEMREERREGGHLTGPKVEVLKWRQRDWTFHTILKMTSKLWGPTERLLAEKKMKFHIAQLKVEIRWENKMTSCLYPHLRLRICSSLSSRWLHWLNTCVFSPLLVDLTV